MNKTTLNFFKAEIRNEKNGGISPSNLSSALDSLNQYPKDYFILDFGLTKSLMKQRLKNLIKKYGGNTKLEGFLR